MTTKPGKDDTRGLMLIGEEYPLNLHNERKAASEIKRIDALRSAVDKAIRGEKLRKPEVDALRAAVLAAEEKFRSTHLHPVDEARSMLQGRLRSAYIAQHTPRR